MNILELTTIKFINIQWFVISFYIIYNAASKFGSYVCELAIIKWVALIFSFVFCKNNTSLIRIYILKHWIIDFYIRVQNVKQSTQTSKIFKNSWVSIDNQVCLLKPKYCPEIININVSNIDKNSIIFNNHKISYLCIIILVVNIKQLGSKNISAIKCSTLYYYFWLISIGALPTITLIRSTKINKNISF